MYLLRKGRYIFVDPFRTFHMLHNKGAGSIFIIIGALLLIGMGLAMRPPATAPNPDPAHVHADIAVWVSGRQLDFNQPKYLLTEEEEEDMSDDSPAKYIHFHEGNSHVIHIHKPGQSLRDFFSALDMNIDETCLETDTGEKICDEGDSAWRMFVNSVEIPLRPGYVLRDLDGILLSYGADDDMAQQELSLLTRDACLYSQACPRRGGPPECDATADCRL